MCPVRLISISLFVSTVFFLFVCFFVCVIAADKYQFVTDARSRCCLEACFGVVISVCCLDQAFWYIDVYGKCFDFQGQNSGSVKAEKNGVIHRSFSDSDAKDLKKTLDLAGKDISKSADVRNHSAVRRVGSDFLSHFVLYCCPSRSLIDLVWHICLSAQQDKTVQTPDRLSKIILTEWGEFWWVLVVKKQLWRLTSTHILYQPVCKRNITAQLKCFLSSHNYHVRIDLPACPYFRVL